MENIALRNLQVFYIILCVQVVTTFEPKVVTISVHNTI